MEMAGDGHIFRVGRRDTGGAVAARPSSQSHGSRAHTACARTAAPRRSDGPPVGYDGDPLSLALIMCPIAGSSSAHKLNLWRAVERSDIDGVRRALDAGFHVGEHKGGRSLVHVALYNNRLDIVALLLEHHAPVERTDAHGLTPLAWAVHWRQNAAALMLLRHGANPHVLVTRTPYSDEPPDAPPVPLMLHACRLTRDTDASLDELLSALVAHGAHVTDRTSNGWTALHYVVYAMKRHYDADLKKHGDRIVRVLLDAGAEIDSRHNADGRTPLEMIEPYMTHPDVAAHIIDVVAMLRAEPARRQAIADRRLLTDAVACPSGAEERTVGEITAGDAGGHAVGDGGDDPDPHRRARRRHM